LGSFLTIRYSDICMNIGSNLPSLIAQTKLAFNEHEFE
jgi:hypothetical protein